MLTHHYFSFRNVPSDSAQGRALAEMVVRLGQTKWCVCFRQFRIFSVWLTMRLVTMLRVCCPFSLLNDSILVHTEETYGFGIQEVFREHAATVGIEVVAALTVPDFDGSREFLHLVVVSLLFFLSDFFF